MKTLKLLLTLSLMALLSLTTQALAMDHGSSPKDMDKGMDHGSMNKSMDHGKDGHMGMNMEGHMMMLGTAEVDGVTAMAHLNDVHEAMAKAGMAKTHHLMIAFEGAQGKIEKGAVAVKVTRPDGTTEKPAMLMGMQGHFGVDLELKEKGTYTFEVGTKLADGKKRQFTFSHEVK